MQNVFDDLNMVLDPLPDEMENNFGEWVECRRAQFSQRYPFIDVEYTRGPNNNCCVPPGMKRHCTVKFRPHANDVAQQGWWLAALVL